MLEYFVYALVTLATIVIGLLIMVAMRPADFRIMRSATMSAPAAEVFAQVNDFHLWNAWSPWAKIDPAMKQVYEGPNAGTGAIYHWLGNKQVGEGRMTIMDSKPSELISIKLEFMKPFAATHTGEFAFKAEGGQTAVTWSMIGNNNFILKAFGLFMNMDKMIGRDFEKGLASMKSVVEAKK
jgi:hypothetical protein